jgi:hypothetical protein
MRHLRIFVSSPGDVGAERAVTLAVIERLQLEFRGQVQLEAYLWERSLLRATDTFQAQIVDIQATDLALFILWRVSGRRFRPSSSAAPTAASTPREPNTSSSARARPTARAGPRRSSVT